MSAFSIQATVENPGDRVERSLPATAAGPEDESEFDVDVSLLFDHIIALEITLNSKELELTRLGMLLQFQRARAEYHFARCRQLKAKLRRFENAAHP